MALAGVGPATASSPPMAPEVSVIGNTLARMMRSHFEPRSMVRSAGRFWVVSTCFQLSSRVAMDPPEIGNVAGASGPGKMREHGHRQDGLESVREEGS